MAETYEWARRFAWLPTLVGDRWIWLREFEARTDYYRPLFEERRLPTDALAS
jgi:hypothetical protein